MVTVLYRGVEIPVATPRRVRLSRRGKFHIFLALLFGGFCIFLAPLLDYLNLVPLLDYLTEVFWVALVLVPLGVYLAVYWALRHRRLLSTGELTLGHVTHQENRSRPNDWVKDHYITYCFHDYSGREVTKTSQDYTRSFYEGMTVPVIYDRSNPRNNGALCSIYTFKDFKFLP